MGKEYRSLDFLLAFLHSGSSCIGRDFHLTTVQPGQIILLRSIRPGVLPGFSMGPNQIRFDASVISPPAAFEQDSGMIPSNPQPCSGKWGATRVLMRLPPLPSAPFTLTRTPAVPGRSPCPFGDIFDWAQLNSRFDASVIRLPRCSNKIAEMIPANPTLYAQERRYT
jgi:hypothetical protein